MDCQSHCSSLSTTVFDSCWSLPAASAEVARRGQSECVLSLSTGTEAGVEELVKRAHQAGAEIVTEPGQQPWGYAGVFADPDGHVWMVTSASLPWKR
jgi:predicted lactoylglutathione lyase